MTPELARPMRVPWERRSLSEVERRYIKTQRAARVRRERAGWRRSLAGSLIVCGVLAALTLLAERDHPGIVLGFWMTVAAGITIPTVLKERRDLSRRMAAYDYVLEHGMCAERRIVSKRMWEFEEQEDEGACYAFELEAGGVAFVVGQDYYSDARFPNSDFSLVEFTGPNDEIFDMLIVKRGVKLIPARIVTAIEKARWEVPEHGTLFNGTLEQVYEHLKKD